MNGARFFATNADKTCPMPGRRGIPDAGATIAALEHLTGRTTRTAGRQTIAAHHAGGAGSVGRAADRCMMVGDRLETDILMGQQAGMATAAVLTGVATRADVEEMEYPPDYVIEDLSGLLELIV